MAIQVTNTSSQLSGKTIIDAEDNQTITGVKTFDLDPSAPFVVSASSAVVTNLDADKVDGKHSSALLLLDGTQAMTGKLDLGTNGQIQFPASQNASANANCLDDYEEGTWTPVDASAGSLSFSNVSGTYAKIGRMVFVAGRFDFPATADTSAISIGGLPFTVENSVHNWGGHFNYVTSSRNDLIATVSNSTTFNFWTNAGAAVTNSSYSSVICILTLTYRAAN